MLKRMPVDSDGSLRNCARCGKMAGMLALVLLSTSCRKPQATEIPGPYNRDRTLGKEWLELKPDRSFVQVYSNATLVRTNIGQWAFQATPPTLVLQNALTIDDSPGHPPVFAMTNGWKLKAMRLAGLILFEDPDKDPLARVTVENQ